MVHPSPPRSCNPLWVPPTGNAGARGAEHTPPLRVAPLGADAPGATAAAVVIVDTVRSLSSVCAASLSHGAQAVRVYADGDAVLRIMRDDDEEEQDEDAYRVGPSDTRAVFGGVPFETLMQREISRLRAQVEEAQEQLEELQAGAQKNRAFRAIATHEDMDTSDDPIAKQTAAWIAQAKQRVADAQEDLSVAQRMNFLSGTAVVSQEAQALRQRAVFEARATERWRGTSFEEYELSVGPCCPMVHYACGNQPWQVLRSVISNGTARGNAKRPVLLCSPTNFEAVRKAIIAWWRQLHQSESRNNPTQPWLVFRPVTRSATNVDMATARSDAHKPHTDSSDALRTASSDEIVCSLLLYQLMQSIELELGEYDMLTRALLREVVTAAAADGTDVTERGRKHIERLLHDTGMQEQRIQRQNSASSCEAEDHHDPVGSTNLSVFEFNRHSVAPVLIRSADEESGPNCLIFEPAGPATLVTNSGNDDQAARL